MFISGFCLWDKPLTTPHFPFNPASKFPRQDSSRVLCVPGRSSGGVHSMDWFCWEDLHLKLSVFLWFCWFLLFLFSMFIFFMGFKFHVDVLGHQSINANGWTVAPRASRKAPSELALNGVGPCDLWFSNSMASLTFIFQLYCSSGYFRSEQQGSRFWIRVPMGLPSITGNLTHEHKQIQ